MLHTDVGLESVHVKIAMR